MRACRHEDARAHRKRPRERRALTLSAREFARILVEDGPGEPYDLQQGFGRALPLPLPPRRVVPYEPQRLVERLADRHARVERAHRVLEHHLHVPPVGAARRPVERRDVLPAEEDFAPGNRLEEHERLRDRRLAAAALAHDAERFALGEREAHPLHRLQGLLARAAVGDVEIVDLEERAHDGVLLVYWCSGIGIASPFSCRERNGSS